MRLWERYVTREFLKSLAFFLGSFYLLYILLDYSGHPERFFVEKKFQWKNFALYYLCEFSRRFGSLAPYTLLVASIKTLLNLTQHNELLAMMVSGRKTKALLAPLFCIGLFFTALMFVNLEFFVPKTIVELNRINDAHKFEKKAYRERPNTQHVMLKDGTTLLFQRFDQAKKIFHDVYWVQSIDKIAHIKQLFVDEAIPRGEFIDHFRRNEKEQLLHEKSEEAAYFPQIKFSRRRLMDMMIPPEEQPMSRLYRMLPKRGAKMEREAHIVSAFYNKLALPWLCLLAVIAPAPFCIRFSRQLPVFMIYAFSLFGMTAIIIILNAALIVGKRLVLDPFWVTWTPFLLFSGYFSSRFAKIN